MGTTCVAYRVWSSNRFRLLLTQRGEAGADGKEDVSDYRPDRDLRALVRGPFPGPDRREFGPGPQDGPQVSGPGNGPRTSARKSRSGRSSETSSLPSAPASPRWVSKSLNRLEDHTR